MTTEQKLNETREQLNSIRQRAAFIFESMYGMIHLQQEGIADISLDAVDGFAIESISLVADIERLQRIGEA